MLPESSKSPRKKKTNIRSCHLQENPLVLEAQTFQIWQSALNQKYEQTFILICLHICQKTVENRVMPSRLHIHTIEPSKSSMATSRSEIYNVFQILCCVFFHSSVFLEAQERKIVMIKTQNEGSVSCLYIKQAIG